MGQNHGRLRLFYFSGGFIFMDFFLTACSPRVAALLYLKFTIVPERFGVLHSLFFIAETSLEF